MSTITEDKKLLIELGGATKVAAALGFDTSNGGVQRVQNWMSRGIPPKEKLKRPDLFLQHLTTPTPRRRKPAAASPA